MLKKIFQNEQKIMVLMILGLLLISIRMFETKLFYDPFLAYFKNSSSTNPLPIIDYFKLFFGLFFRYLLNTIISLSIIYVLFKDIHLTQFASFLYLIFFIILISSFFVVLNYFGETNKMTLFYIRRFLIQPIFLLLFVPAFYFQNKAS